MTFIGGSKDNLESLINDREEVQHWEDPETQQSMLSMFQIDLDNYLKVKFGLMYHLHLPPEDIEKWPYWEYEMHVEMLADVLKKKQQGENQQSKEMNQQQINPQTTANNFMKKAQSSQPKVSMPSFRMPR